MISVFLLYAYASVYALDSELSFIIRCKEFDTALVREFQGILGQVDKDLLQAVLVSVEQW